ncbi:hypothetical protein PHYPSEUDO_002561 [Phytophthora pseudosyringae]|uniref:Uncharacterized protein n=1 Tax=Phytophthora pseudosyringae TaxID=221518 RepID=A0A8T1V527_9STRA|nr:hypothetical protein PHYPSEUDO_002561 [Phytophthora pseudosyringae]
MGEAATSERSEDVGAGGTPVDSEVSNPWLQRQGQSAARSQRRVIRQPTVRAAGRDQNVIRRKEEQRAGSVPRTSTAGPMDGTRADGSGSTARTDAENRQQPALRTGAPAVVTKGKAATQKGAVRKKNREANQARAVEDDEVEQRRLGAEKAAREAREARRSARGDESKETRATKVHADGDTTRKHPTARIWEPKDTRWLKAPMARMAMTGRAKEW